MTLIRPSEFHNNSVTDADRSIAITVVGSSATVRKVTTDINLVSKQWRIYRMRQTKTPTVLVLR